MTSSAAERQAIALPSPQVFECPHHSNIYLHRLDEFVETVLIPEYTRGRIRKQDNAYARVRAARDRAHRRGDRATARELRQQLRGMPSGDPRDPGFRRLHYARYADDTLLGFAGPKAEAEQVKGRLAAFLRNDLKLELSQEKTLITHARTQAAKFLGYEITVHHNDRKVTQGRRSANGVVGLHVPSAVIKAKSAPLPGARSHISVTGREPRPATQTHPRQDLTSPSVDHRMSARATKLEGGQNHERPPQPRGRDGPRGDRLEGRQLAVPRDDLGVPRADRRADGVNTSFNDNEEPIVCTPQDVVRCYLKTDMDALALGSFWTVD